MSALGRVMPPDWEHLSKYPLRTLIDAGEVTKPVPVAIGINWYTNLDRPSQDSQGRWWVGRGEGSSLGTLRGGHCVCLKPEAYADLVAWWTYYNQGREGSCEGHGHARMQSLENRYRYDAVWLYNEARKIDGIPGAHEGTTNRASLEVLRTQGLRRATGPVTTALRSSAPPAAAEGISAYRWATTVDEVLVALGSPSYARIGGVPMLNSWGRDYPHVVWLTLDALGVLLAEDGEAGVVTDR